MTRRPSFQFYPGDWSGNQNVKRCTHAEKGMWMDILCLMHDSEEYGVLRWTLAEIARAVGSTVPAVSGLVRKQVMRGCDIGMRAQGLIYVPRSGRKDGAPVELIPEQEGPIFFSSRMVKDEYVRKTAGASTRFGADAHPSPSRAPSRSPSHRGGEDQGDGSSSSSASSEKKERSSYDDPKKRGCRIQADWWPTDADIEFAEGLSLPESLVDVFRDYWLSKPGKDGVKLDWSATWRNWCRREAKNKQPTFALARVTAHPSKIVRDSNGIDRWKG